MSEKLQQKCATLVLTLRCNLNCRLCCAQMPYYKNPTHYPIEILKKTVDRYFMVVDHVDRFTLSGGEVTIYPELTNILEYLLKYSKRMGILEILTNGTMIPDQKTLNILSYFGNADVLIDDYGPELSRQVQQLIARLEQHGIKYRHRIYYGNNAYCNGWVDLTQICPKNRTEDDTARVYAQCINPWTNHVFAIFGGKAVICGVYQKCMFDGIIPDLPDEYVDFLADKFDVEKVKKQIREFYNRRYFSACALCDGFLRERPRFIPAEQIGR